MFAVLESEDINELRVEVETQNKVKAMEMKKKLKAQQEIMEKIKEKQNKQKELEYKNVTVDVNGNLVQIKPISLESLANEFTNPNTKYNEIQLIEAPDLLRGKKVL